MAKYFNIKSILFILVVIGAVSYYLYTSEYKGNLNKISGLKSDIESISTQINDLSTKKSETDSFKSSIKKYRKRVIKNFSRIVKQENIAELFNTLLGKAERNLRLDVYHFKPGKSIDWPLPKKSSGDSGGDDGGGDDSSSKKKPKKRKKFEYFIRPLNMKIRGKIKDIFSFLDWLEKIPPFIVIERVLFLGARSRGNIDVQLDLFTFSFYADFKYFLDKSILKPELKEEIDTQIATMISNAKTQEYNNFKTLKNALIPQEVRVSKPGEESEEIKDDEDFEEAEDDDLPMSTMEFRKLIKIGGIIFNEKLSKDSQVTINGREYRIGQRFLVARDPELTESRAVKILNIKKESVRVEADGKEFELYMHLQ
ncbi:hypothetical protein ACFL35_11110 [Candidatus Riflebacteria bacterium]